MDRAETEMGRLRVLTLDPGVGGAAGAVEACSAVNQALGSVGDSRVCPASVELRDGRLVMTSPAPAGRGLHELISPRQLLEREAVHVLIQICEALEAAHRVGALHGALTPFSITVDGYDESATIQITDFGLGDIVPIARTEQGDPRWFPFAPERMMGDDPVPATDVYLVGTIAYALLGGTPVFDGDSFDVLQRSHSIEEPLDLRELNVLPPVPDMLSLILMRCLVKEPEDRYQGPGELASALRGFLQTLEDDEPQTLMIRAVPKAPQKAPLQYTAPIPVAGDNRWEQPRPVAPAPPEPRRRGASGVKLLVLVVLVAGVVAAATWFVLTQVLHLG